MTAVGRSATPELVDVAPAAPREATPRAQAISVMPRARVPRAAALPFAVAVLAPVALFTWRAMRAPINFDGGMNLQVAERLAQGDGYTRFYDELLTFPHEVQTNGPFMYAAASSIKVFGANQLGYQFTNLIFIAALAGVVFYLLRSHAVLRVVGPLLVLLALPRIAVYGLGGLGEIPMTALVLGAVLGLTEAVRSPGHAPRWAFGAFVAFGAALATKTFAQGAVVGLTVGLLCVLLAVPTERLRWKVVLATSGALVAPAIREVHRLLSLGSVGQYRAWWAEERSFISTQSGLDQTDGNAPTETFLDHMHTLSELVDFPAELLLAFLFLPLVAVGGLILLHWREQGLRRTLTDPTMAVLLMVAGIAASYIVWWMLMVPVNKLWIRRITPGLLAIHLLYLLLVPQLVRAVRAARRRFRDDRAPQRARWIRAAAAAAGLVLVSLAVLPYVGGKVNVNTRALAAGEPRWLDATRGAAAYVRDHGEQRFYGDEWWSAPVVSLTSGTDFYNLGDADFCSLDPARDRLVWDYDAKTILRPEPWTRSGSLAFDEVARFGEYVTIYAVGPAPGYCA
jgi:hypothetical protein